MDFENALIYRRVFNVDEGHVVVKEKWDVNHPECPFVKSPFHAMNPYQTQSIRQARMTVKEFEASKLALKQAPPHQ